MIYNEIRELLKKKKARLSDNTHQVLSKLGKLDPKIRSFLKKNWDEEKNFLLDPSQDNTDPAFNEGYILKIGDSPFRVFRNRAFSVCPKCGGRLFPDFDFCPYCGFEVGGIDREPQRLDRNRNIDRKVEPQELDRKYLDRHRRNGIKKWDGIRRWDIFGPHHLDTIGEVIVEDEEVKVTEKDVKDAEREIGKYLP